MTLYLTHFPLADYWWFYLAFTAAIIVLLALDLGIFHKNAHSVSFKEAGIWSAIWISLALAFNTAFYFYASNKFGHQLGATLALEFLAGYIIEYSLSVDNIFVFVLVFAYFAIPSKLQHRVLFYGILGALIFRGIFIAVGSALMQYHWVIYIFGGFLIFTGVKMLFSDDAEVDPEKNLVVKTFKRFVPVTPHLEGQKFFIRLNGVLHATPLFIALLFLELSDIIFAIDSVPAIFAITKEPLIVFTSNVLAILGLRSLYFLLAEAVDKFHLLKYALSVILVFVGLKMTILNPLWGGKFPILYSLAFILGTLAVSIIASILMPLKNDKPQNGEKSD